MRFVQLAIALLCFITFAMANVFILVCSIRRGERMRMVDIGVGSAVEV